MPPAITPYQAAREEGEIKLACEACKRRKTKCNREVPVCEACAKLGRQCIYPAQAGKPGPKPGWRKGKNVSPPVNNTTTTTSTIDVAMTMLPAPLPYLPVPTTSPTVTDPSVRSNATRTTGEWPSTSDGISAPAETSVNGSPRRSSNTGQEKGLPRRGAWLFHPDHDTLLVENPCNSPEMTHATSHEEILGLDTTTIRYLIEVYLENMTALTLFHRPTFWQKLESIPQPKVRAALLAAMFSFSVRYTPAPPGFTAQMFHDMAFRVANEALDDYGDSQPCVHLSQSAVLISFFELADGVRGKAWRTLGATVRCAIEMKLNAVDANPVWPPESVDAWILQEERRRLFWSLWEFDVFAGTIRRAPNSIDWKTCRTMLPVGDADWFNGTPQRSCFLHPDPFRRLKELNSSGNEGGRAWFIVINSFMREAHLYTEQLYVPETTKPNQEIPPQLEILENAAACFKMTLPQDLQCSESMLEFDSKPGSVDQRTIDAQRYSIYAMQQLTQMMIHRHLCVKSISSPDFQQMVRGGTLSHDVHVETSQATVEDCRRYSWSRFKHAAENIVRLARVSPPHHVQSVSPFLASTIWIAAAALVTCEVFAQDKIEAEASRSKVEVLRLLLDRFASFWKSSNSLVYRLLLVRRSLKRIQRAESRNVTPPDTPNSELLENAMAYVPTTNVDTSPKQVVPQAVYPESLGADSENTLSDWLLEPSDANNLFPDFDPINLDIYGGVDLDRFIMSITSGGAMGPSDFDS